MSNTKHTPEDKLRKVINESGFGVYDSTYLPELPTYLITDAIQEYANQQIQPLLEILIECEEYFDNKADVDHDHFGKPNPNPEMQMLTKIRNVIQKIKL